VRILTHKPFEVSFTSKSWEYKFQVNHHLTVQHALDQQLYLNYGDPFRRNTMILASLSSDRVPILFQTLMQLCVAFLVSSVVCAYKYLILVAVAYPNHIEMKLS